MRTVYCREPLHNLYFNLSAQTYWKNDFCVLKYAKKQQWNPSQHLCIQTNALCSYLHYPITKHKDKKRINWNLRISPSGGKDKMSGRFLNSTENTQVMKWIIPQLLSGFRFYFNLSVFSLCGVTILMSQWGLLFHGSPCIDQWALIRSHAIQPSDRNLSRATSSSFLIELQAELAVS